MRKLFKLIFGIFVIVMVVFIACAAIITFDVAGALATETHPLPHGDPVGQAIIVYDPGLSGGAKNVATQIGYNLQDKGYNVVLAGVKSITAADISSYDIIVVGGPIYSFKPAKTIQEYLGNLSPADNQKVGVFGYGMISIDESDYSAVMQDVAALGADSNLALNAAIKVVSGDDVDTKCQDFTNHLIP